VEPIASLFAFVKSISVFGFEGAKWRLVAALIKPLTDP
jgi:hypothetical protein